MEGDVHRIRLHVEQIADLRGRQVGAVTERDELAIALAERPECLGQCDVGERRVLEPLRRRLACELVRWGNAASRLGEPRARDAEILRRTVDWLRDPASGVPADVGITDGFASQRPWPSAVTSPTGLTALSKHPYGRKVRFPAEETSGVPVDARGQLDSPAGGSNAVAAYVPSYNSCFLEYFLTAIQTEHLGVHGRTVRVSAGDPLTGQPVDVPVVARGTDRVTVDFPATDSPRLLVLANA